MLSRAERPVRAGPLLLLATTPLALLIHEQLMLMLLLLKLLLLTLQLAVRSWAVVRLFLLAAGIVCCAAQPVCAVCPVNKGCVCRRDCWAGGMIRREERGWTALSRRDSSFWWVLKDRRQLI